MDSVNTELFRGRVDTIILSVLKDKPHYGYEILELIVKNSVSHFEIKQSTLYNSLKRLENNGLVSSFEGEETNGAKRKYYSLTTNGKDYLDKEQKEWQYTRTLLDKLVSEETVDLTAIVPPFNPKDLRPLTHRVKNNDENDNEIESLVASNNPFTETNALLPEVNFTESTNQAAPPTENITNPDYSLKKEPESSEFILGREKASSILGLGNFSLNNPSPQNTFNNSNQQPTISTIGIDYDNNLGRNYRDALSNIFNSNAIQKEEPDLSSEKYDNLVIPEDNIKNDNIMIRSQHFNDMKNSLVNEGYKVQVYNKANSSNYYYMNYYYANKLIKDSLIITFLIMLLELVFLVVFHPPLKTLYWTILGTSVIIPIYALTIYFLNPNKRIKAKFKVIKSFSISMALFLALSIMTYLISSQLNMEKQTYTVYIILLNIPIFVVISFILFRTNKYHLKK